MAASQDSADKKVNLGMTYEDTAIPPPYEAAIRTEALAAAQPVRNAVSRFRAKSLTSVMVCCSPFVL